MKQNSSLAQNLLTSAFIIFFSFNFLTIPVVAIKFIIPHVQLVNCLHINLILISTHPLLLTIIPFLPAIVFILAVTAPVQYPPTTNMRRHPNFIHKVHCDVSTDHPYQRYTINSSCCSRSNVNWPNRK